MHRLEMDKKKIDLKLEFICRIPKKYEKGMSQGLEIKKTKQEFKEINKKNFRKKTPF